MKRILLSLVFYCIVSAILYAQPAATKAGERVASAEKKLKMIGESNVALDFRNIGPTIMGGRVVDLEVNPQNPNYFYVAYASGGLWRTTNNGSSFEPLFDNEVAMTIGDIAVDWTHGEKIWIGTGENNSSRSSYSGTGVFISEDKGKTWKNKGLAETQHTGRVILHPENPQTAWVAAIGHLYTHDPERGVFKTTDGGNTWRKILYLNDSTGVIDMVIDPFNPETLYAAAWERTRKSWNFDGEGKASGIYKSTDGGENWTLLSHELSGFPYGTNTGRIGLAISARTPDLLYAVVDNHKPDTDKEDKDKPKLRKADLRTMSASNFINLPEKEINDFLDYYDFPAKHTAKTVLDQVKKGTLKPADLAEYLSDANQDLFDVPIVGGEVYGSADGGKTWKKTHTKPLENLFYGYGYYFAQIRVSPLNDQEIYILGVPALRSLDGGKTFTGINKEHTHPDHHALWISPAQEGHLILGNDGGLDLSYDKGNTFTKMNRIPVGQFYAVNVDSAKPYNVYGGLQDNGVWVGSSKNVPDNSWHQSGRYPFEEIYGGDGMQIMIDGRDNKTIYTGYQFGNYARIENGQDKSIGPQHELGEKPFRFNWQTPILLSRHNQDILYMGANRVFRSMDKGESFKPISPDLTTGGTAGNVPYGTITALDESPFQFGVMYAGTDDGKVYFTQSAGAEWKEITTGLPSKLWVSRIVASKHKKERVYLTLNGYRWDHFDAYVYVSEDFGNQWTRIATDLPLEPVNVIREDPKNPDLLYFGTDNGLYLSQDGGKTVLCLNNATLPNVAVHDLVIHPKANEIVVGTHGRSIYIADVQHLQQLTPEIQKKDFHIFPPDSLTYYKYWGDKGFDWSFSDTPTVKICFYQKNPGGVSVKVFSEKGTEIYSEELPQGKGLRTWSYDLTLSPLKADKLKPEIKQEKIQREWDMADNGKFYLPPGNYKVQFTTALQLQSTTLLVKAPKEKPKRGEKKTP